MSMKHGCPHCGAGSMGKGGVVKCGSCGKHFAEGGEVQAATPSGPDRKQYTKDEVLYPPGSTDIGVTARPPKRAMDTAGGEKLPWRRRPGEVATPATAEAKNTPAPETGTITKGARPPAPKSTWARGATPFSAGGQVKGVVERLAQEKAGATPIGGPLKNATSIGMAAELAQKGRLKPALSFTRRTMKGQP